MIALKINVIDVALLISLVILTCNILMHELEVYVTHRSNVPKNSANLYGHFMGDFGGGVTSR